MWFCFLFSKFLFMLGLFCWIYRFTILELIWRVFYLRPNYRLDSNMINVNCISVCMNLVYVKLKFVIFSILELIWRAFFLWPNYRPNSNMIIWFDMIIIKFAVLPGHVRFVMVNWSLSPFVNEFGAFPLLNKLSAKFLRRISIFKIRVMSVLIPFFLTLKYFSDLSIQEDWSSLKYINSQVGNNDNKINC